LGNVVPDEPLIFLKPPSSVIASGDPIVVPSGVGRVDYEGEIGILIGTPARHVSEDDAWSVVEGILPLNDVTARDLQKKDSQWSRAKGFDTFCALGSVHSFDPDGFLDLVMVTRVNGVERQRAPASQMVFSVPTLIAYISRIMTLEPGDVIATGTPEGIGALKAGDEVEVEIEGVGVLRNPVVGEEDDA
jgi:2-keto-4-pentenoate hydratase/2-oxohepta-3-ene-1,7-dioic acid hydratase in catechol pathway